MVLVDGILFRKNFFMFHGDGMRLIDADAFAEFIKDTVKRQGYDNLKLDPLTVSDVLDAVISELDGTSLDGFKNAPTVDAVPVVHGHWIDCGITGFRKCPYCGSLWGISLINNKFFLHCPRCGVRIDKGDME